MSIAAVPPRPRRELEQYQQQMAVLRKEGVRLGAIGNTSTHSGFTFGIVLRPRGIHLGEIRDDEYPKFFLEPDDEGVADPLGYVHAACRGPVFVYAKRVRELRPFILMAEPLCSRGVWVTAV